MAFAFLPVQLIRQNFVTLAGSRKFRRMARQYPQIRAFVHYMHTTYFTGRFPAAMCNLYTRNSRNNDATGIGLLAKEQNENMYSKEILMLALYS